MSHDDTATQLDAAIYRELFGADPAMLPPEGFEDVRQKGAAGGWQITRPLPKYSTTWTGAGLLIEAMFSRGASLTVQRDGRAYYARFDHFDWAPTMAKGETAEEAVARAAIEAVRGSKEAKTDG